MPATDRPAAAATWSPLEKDVMLRVPARLRRAARPHPLLAAAGLIAAAANPGIRAEEAGGAVQGTPLRISRPVEADAFFPAEPAIAGTPVRWPQSEPLEDRFTPFPMQPAPADDFGEFGEFTSDDNGRTTGTVAGEPYFPAAEPDDAEPDDADPDTADPDTANAIGTPVRLAQSLPTLPPPRPERLSRPTPTVGTPWMPGTPSGQDRLIVPPIRRSTPSPVTLAELLDAEDAFVAEQQQAAADSLMTGRDLDPGWWQPLVGVPLGREAVPVSLTLDDAILRTLEHSLQVQVFADLPLIRETAIVEADAAFDWQTFLESRWDDTSDPVGNSLTAGAGIDRFRDHHLSAQGGVRRRTLSGGSLQAAQQFGLQNNNSEFFVPNDQGSSRLTLSFTQPLLKGRGRAYNSSLVCLARLDKTVADDEFRRQLQAHLLEVTRAYWALYFERGVLLQKMNTYRRARATVARLEARKRIDASESQVRAARAALKARGSELIRARVGVANAGAKLRTLINDPALGCEQSHELLPVDRPIFATHPADMGASLAAALQRRPEVMQSIKQIRAAGMRQSMSRNELLPLLNIVTEAYVAGLADSHSIGEAWTNQFSVGEPGYAVGLQFEVPIGNRAARTRHIRRCHELRQMQNQYALTLSTVELEVRTSVREVNASQQELAAKEEAMQARVDQMNYIEQRWQRLPGQGTSAVLTLENLLLAQERVAAAEFEYLESQMTYNLALMNLKRTTGLLLQAESIQIGRGCQDGLPTQYVGRASRSDEWTVHSGQ